MIWCNAAVPSVDRLVTVRNARCALAHRSLPMLTSKGASWCSLSSWSKSSTIVVLNNTFTNICVSFFVIHFRSNHWNISWMERDRTAFCMKMMNTIIVNIYEMLVYDDTDATVRHRWWWRYCQQSVDQNRRLAKCWQNSRMWGEGGFCFLALISCYPAPALIVQVQSSASSSPSPSSILWTCSLLLS